MVSGRDPRTSPAKMSILLAPIPRPYAPSSASARKRSPVSVERRSKEMGIEEGVGEGEGEGEGEEGIILASMVQWYVGLIYSTHT